MRKIGVRVWRFGYDGSVRSNAPQKFHQCPTDATTSFESLVRNFIANNENTGGRFGDVVVKAEANWPIFAVGQDGVSITSVMNHDVILEKIGQYTFR
mmetsp:Transcript_20839/g.55675  ORF Transcript_20839/g.55675 Transcript_20839/m.55675 type:complete len:97 (-) Transcript_20839:25-315(-)